MSLVCDLGCFDGPVLIFGGPYSNLEATRAVLAEADRLGVPAGCRICTGDVVAYCADPQATLDVVRASGTAVVMGNVEESLAADAGDCGCGFAENSACDLMAAKWYAFARANLDDGAKLWMSKLPRAITFELGGRRLFVTHGAPSAISRFVFGSAPDSVLAAEIRATDCDGVVAGHCGLPFTRVVDGMLWHNAGVIGMPANDGTARIWYSLLFPDGDGLAISHHALDYDHTGAAAGMRDRGLPEGYAEALETGLWPNLDILPSAERARCGVPLAFESMIRWPAGSEPSTSRNFQGNSRAAHPPAE